MGRLIKSNEEKWFETKSMIRQSYNTIDKLIRNEQNLLKRSIETLKASAKQKNKQQLMNSVGQIRRITAVIQYLKSFQIYLTNSEITFEQIRSEVEMHNMMKKINEDMGKVMLTPQQANMIESNIEKIASNTENLERRMQEQYTMLQGALNKYGESDGTAEKIIEDITGKKISEIMGESSSSEDSEIDALLKKLVGDSIDDQKIS
ncbi:hypothetical protein [Caldiplasma sukawensis]